MLRDVRQQQLLTSSELLHSQQIYDQGKLPAMMKSAAPIVGQDLQGNNIYASAEKTKDIYELNMKIAQELQGQLDASRGIAEIEIERRRIQREFIASQNYGSWRSVGGGGHSIFDSINGAPSVAERIGLMKGGARGSQDLIHRVSGAHAPAHFGQSSFPMGSIQGLDVLKSIDKNIGKIGVPTLAN